jgi:hypothetical protein
MAIDFPASPTLNQTFTSGNVNYVWDGTKWTAAVSGGIALDQITEGNTKAEVIDTGSDGRFVVTTEGSERARVDSSGRLLVGTSTSYGVPATIAGPAATLTTGTGTYSVLSIADTNSMAAGVGGGIAFQGNDGVNGLVAFSQVQGFKENNTSGNFAGGLSFSTRLNGAGLTERMRVDSSGRLGIATTSPSETLHVNGNARASHFLSQGWFVGQGNLTTADARSGVTGIGPSSSSSPGDFYGAYAWFYGAAHNTRPGDIEIGTGLNTNGSIQFRINNTERMRIDNNGNIGIGRIPNNTSGQIVDIKGNDARIRVNDNKSDTGEVGIEFGLSGGGGGNNTAKVAVMAKAANVSNGRANLVFYVDTADDGNPWSSGDEAMRINLSRNLLIGYTSDNGSSYKLQVNSQIFATSSTIATSDGRYKENVTTLGGCVDLVKALRPVSFTWKPQQDVTFIDDEGNEVLAREGHNFPDGTQVGFIAQEVQEVLAEKPWLTSVIKQNVRPAVTDKAGNELAPEEEFLGIAEGNLIAVLTSALQEAIGRIETLEAKVAALESPTTALEIPVDPSSTDT